MKTNSVEIIFIMLRYRPVHFEKIQLEVDPRKKINEGLKN